MIHVANITTFVYHGCFYFDNRVFFKKGELTFDYKNMLTLWDRPSKLIVAVLRNGFSKILISFKRVACESRCELV